MRRPPEDKDGRILPETAGEAIPGRDEVSDATRVAGPAGIPAADAADPGPMMAAAELSEEPPGIVPWLSTEAAGETGSTACTDGAALPPPEGGSGEAGIETGTKGETGSETAEGPRRAAAAFIYLTVALDMLALGMVAPVLPHLIGGFVGGSTARTAEMIGLFGTIFAAMQFFFSPVLGSLSDRFGRRPIVLLSNFGLGMDYILMAMAPSLGFLLVGRVLAGITASSVPTAQAYMSDVTPRERRAAAFGMLQAAFGFGFVVGPALGGWLGSVSPRLPFLASAGLSLTNAVYGYFVLPESLSRQNRSRFSWKRANPMGSVRLLARSKTRMVLAGVLLLGYLAQNSLLNVYVIYADYRYHWSDRTVGMSLAALGTISILYGFFLVRRASAWIGDRRATLYGLTGGALGYVMLASAPTGMWFVAGIPLLNLTSIAWPSTQSILSRSAGPNEQGQLQGAINSLRGTAGMLGPGLFGLLFAKSVGDWKGLGLPGLPYYVAAALMFSSVLLCLLAGDKDPAAH